MTTLSKSQRARTAIRMFKTTADALALRGYYKPSGRSGHTLSESLRILSPEIYGSINDPRIIELKGLEYAIHRLPRGIEECTRIILTAEEDLDHTAFDKIIPRKRRRTSYRTGLHEMTFIITKGMSEIYDILTHLTFFNIEAEKIYSQMKLPSGETTREWQLLEEHVKAEKLEDEELDRALWNLSIILGRTFHETRETHADLEKSRLDANSNHSLFRIVHSTGLRLDGEKQSEQNRLTIYFTPSLRDMIGSHRIGRLWADEIKNSLYKMGLHERPIHIISANMHSVVNALYACAALGPDIDEKSRVDLYELIHNYRDRRDPIKKYALEHGLYEISDCSGTYIDCQIIDTEKLKDVPMHPEIRVRAGYPEGKGPVIIVMDYAFGSQAFEVMEELLSPLTKNDKSIHFPVESISIMGKAGILPGNKGDILLATAHVFEGTPHNYIVNNDLSSEDFDGSIKVYTGPIVTVLGTSLQNRDVLEKFQKTSWNAVGLEMEGGHYQRAINAAIIRGHIPREVKVRYAYYASDNPLQSGQTLSSGGLGEEGIRPTYMITKVILEKILS